MKSTISGSYSGDTLPIKKQVYPRIVRKGKCIHEIELSEPCRPCLELGYIWSRAAVPPFTECVHGTRLSEHCAECDAQGARDAVS